MARPLTLFEQSQRLIAAAGKFSAGTEAAYQLAFRQAAGLVRLPPSVLAELGFSPKSRRYVPFGVAPTRENTVSARKATERTLGVTKEKYTAEVRANPSRYRFAGSRENVRTRRRLKIIRQIIEGVSTPDAKLIDKVAQRAPTRGRGGRTSHLTKRQRQRFRELFIDYDRDEVLEALGSPET
jgi:hypothetical protein